MNEKEKCLRGEKDVGNVFVFYIHYRKSMGTMFVHSKSKRKMKMNIVLAFCRTNISNEYELNTEHYHFRTFFYFLLHHILFH